MKNVRLRLVFMVLLLVASVSSYLFLNSNSTIVVSNPQAIYEQTDSTETDPYLQLDVEIIKHLLDQGRYFPIISSTSSSLSDAIE